MNKWHTHHFLRNTWFQGTFLGKIQTDHDELLNICMLPIGAAKYTCAEKAMKVKSRANTDPCMRSRPYSRRHPIQSHHCAQVVKITHIPVTLYPAPWSARITNNHHSSKRDKKNQQTAVPCVSSSAKRWIANQAKAICFLIARLYIRLSLSICNARTPLLARWFKFNKKHHRSNLRFLTIRASILIYCYSNAQPGARRVGVLS